VLDVDTADETIAADAINRHGQPAIIVRTASGKFHHLYRYNGERRRIRPWAERPIDLLGDNGYALAAPSKTAKDSYEIIHGHFDDLDRLTPMAAPPAEAISQPLPFKWTGMRAGDGRNRALWERCMRTGSGRNLEGMMEIARNANQEFKEPMMDAEVVKIATSAWHYDDAGLNFFTRPRIMLDHDAYDALDSFNPNAVRLLLRLERFHGGNSTFVLSIAMAPTMGWGWDTWYAARDALVESGIIRCIKHGGRGPNDPPVYGWALRG
jgi:Bifunctional DNA primase/polymerase, N-terminal